KKGDWDVGIAVDAMKMASRLDAVILVTGDGDYVPLVEYLQTITQVEVVSFGKSSSMKLKEQADDFLDLSLNPKKYLIY
ncbi:NYN domain-containing protein, partial [Candidatus Nomurabacteria bacterium]|nr:NYN domain-containing protein [Candidatus Nomurabacteria bacterium]